MSRGEGLAASQAPGVLKVRIGSSSLHTIAAFRQAVLDATQAAGGEVLEQSDPYPDRRGPGYRLYLTLRMPGQEGESSP